jgi:hypothetical protein
MSLKDIENWGAGKPVVFVMLAKEFAFHAHEYVELVNGINSGKYARGLGRPPTAREMLRLYKDHNRLSREMCTLFTRVSAPGGSIPEDWKKIQGDLRRWAREPVEKRRQDVEEIKNLLAKDKGMAKEIATELHDMHKEQMEEMQAEIAGKDPDVDFTELIKMPEWQFFVRVWAPCLLLYGEYATVLLRKARRGDLNSLLQLVRIDKSVLGDALIADQLAQAHAQGLRGFLGKIAPAIKGTGKRIKPRDAMLRVAALISRDRCNLWREGDCSGDSRPV